MRNIDLRLRDLQGWLLCALIVVSAVVYSFQFTSFLHAKEAVLSVGVILVATLAAWRRVPIRNGVRCFLPLWVGLAVALISGLAGARLWFKVIEESGRLATLLLLAGLSWEYCQDPVWRRRIGTALVGSATGIAALGLVQHFDLVPVLFPRFEHYDQRIYSVFGNQDLLGGYLAIGASLLAAGMFRAARQHPVRYAAMALMLSVLVLSGSRSAWLAALAGMLCAVPWTARTARRTAAVSAALLAIVAATALLTWPQTSGRVTHTLSTDDVGGRARLWFWDGTLRMIRDAPWWGTGLGNYAYWSPSYLGEALAAPGGDRHYRNEIHTEHAHSEPLEYLAEIGIIGGVFGLWMLYRMVRRPGAAWGGLAALLVFAGFNAAFHSAPHAWAGLLMCAMLHVRGEFATEPDAPHHRAWWWLPAPLALVLAGLMTWTVYMPSRWLREAEDVHLAGGDAPRYYARVLAHPWPNPQAHEEYGMALLDAGRTTDAYAQFVEALHGLDTGRLHLLLGIAADRLGDRQTAAEWLEQCLRRWPDNEQARMLLDGHSAEFRNQQP
jgi:O-antigen ligase